MFSLTNTSVGHLEGIAAEILSSRTRQVFEVVNYVILCSLVGLFGLLTNTVNMVVFCQQGCHNTMTISFMALTISDQCSLITLEWFNVFMNPLVASSDIPFSVEEVHSLLAGWPHVTFSRITGWITAYITAERCLCITAPLAVKRIITPRRTTCILVCIYVINIAVLLPEYSTSYISWKFYPDRNRTLLGVLFTTNSESAEGLVFFLHALLVLGAFLCVSVLTVVLVIQLQVASKWRQEAARGETRAASIAKKDKNAAKMVVMISGLLICMYTPGILLSLVRFIEPKFGIFGEFQNLFMTIWSFGFLCNAINSSVNIFMYYSMSSNYRDTSSKLFSKCRSNCHAITNRTSFNTNNHSHRRNNET